LSHGNPRPVRDLWPKEDFGPADGKVSTKMAPHGVVLLKIGKPQEGK
jgi:hypothetical protein